MSQQDPHNPNAPHIDATGEHPRAPTDPASPGPGAGVPPLDEGGDVLDLIADVEQQLASLKAVHRERETVATNLAEREAAVDQREADVRSRLEQVLAEKEALEEARAENDQNERLLAQQQRELDALDKELEERRTQIDAHRIEVERRGSELNEIAQQLDQERTSFEDEREHAERDRQAAEELAAEAQVEAERLRREHAAMRGDRDELAAQVETATAEATELRDRLERAGVEAEALEASLREELRAAQQEASERAERLTAEHGAEIERLESELATSRERAERAEAGQNAAEEESTGLRAQVEAMRTAAADLESRFEEERAAFGENESALRSRIDELTGSIESERASLRSVTEERDVLSERVRVLAEKFKEMSAALVEQTELNASESAAEAEARNRVLESELDEARRATLEAEARAEAAERAVGEARASADASAESPSAQVASGDRVTELEAELAQARLALAEADSRAEAEAEARIAAEAETQAVAERAASSGLDEARATGPASVGAASIIPDPIARRARLARAKRLVQSQAAKVRRASEALSRRYQQCEDLLAQRADVVRAKQRLEGIESKVGKTSMVKAFGISAACVALAVGLLAALSVAGAREFWPGRFLAHAVIELDPGDRDIGPEAAASWTLAHQDLAKDPHFIEAVSDRMRRRGIASLGSGPALTAYLDEHMVIESPEPGRLTFALEGDGPDRTERILQTYAVTLANHANQSRARRLDGAGTRISQDASADSNPVDESELIHAGIIFAGSFAGVFLLGGGIATRMVSTKKKFEYDETVERVLDDARWVDPRQAAESRDDPESV